MSIADKLTTIAQNEQKVFDAGHTVGYHAGKSVGYQEGNQIGYETGFQEGRSEGYNEGVDIGRDIGMQEGKKAEHDEFWDAVQEPTKEDTEYSYKFSYWRTEGMYNPKYPIRTTRAECVGTFRGAIGIKDTLVDIDVSVNTTKIDYMFWWNTGIKTIRKLKVSEKITRYVQTFYQCTALENITIEGTINASIELQWSTKLSHDSFVSIINALSLTASGLSVTFSLEAVRKAFETSQEALDGNTSSQWLALIATKPNWTIALIDKNGNKYTFDQDYID